MRVLPVPLFDAHHITCIFLSGALPEEQHEPPYLTVCQIRLTPTHTSTIRTDMITTFAMTFPSAYIAFFLSACLQAAHILHDAQLPPQDDLPIFLSLIMVRIITATRAMRTMVISIVPMNVLSYFAALAISSLSASLYFLKNSIYTITPRATSANNRPRMFTLPVNAHPT